MCPDSFYLFVLPLLIGYILDSLLGDPRWLPHPVVAFGKAISFMEKQLNRGKFRRAKGCFTTLFLVSAVLLLGMFLVDLLLQWGIVPYCVVASMAVFYGLANSSLIKEGRKVVEALEYQGLEAGRKRLSWIVGRDTSTLDRQQIYTAALETMAENLSDGVVAPLFYYAVGGFPAMLAYKMVNTLDSMVGYKNDRYRKFGWCSARLDDVLNFIPARITATLIAIVAWLYYGRWVAGFIFRYAHCHASPNSGFPESAMAGALKCRFGGPNTYHGVLVNKPYIGDNDREVGISDYFKVACINNIVTLFSVGGLIILWSIYVVFNC